MELLIRKEGRIMSIYVLTSMFKQGFGEPLAKRLNEIIVKKNSFVFIASDFEANWEKNDKYASNWLEMFKKIGIGFNKTDTVDSRISPEQAQETVKNADVIWISGGDTPKQFFYIKKYGLDTVLREHNGIIIGMSAGSINLAKTAVCSLTSGHYIQEVYNGLGCVDLSIEPHFSIDNTDEILKLSQKHKIYGMSDESAIIIANGEPEYFGDIYIIENGDIIPL